MYTHVMNSVISATEARKRFFEIIDWARATEGEIVIEKDGQPAVVLSGAKPVKTKKEIREIIANFRRLMSKYPREKYWSVLDTPQWRKKDRAYLKSLRNT